MYPSTKPPIRFGMKNIVLKNVVPFIALVSANAMANAITFITITLTRAKSAVYQIE